MEDAAERKKRLKLMRDEASAASTSASNCGWFRNSTCQFELASVIAYSASTPTGASLGPLQAVPPWQIR